MGAVERFQDRLFARRPQKRDNAPVHRYSAIRLPPLGLQRQTVPGVHEVELSDTHAAFGNPHWPGGGPVWTQTPAARSHVLATGRGRWF